MVALNKSDDSLDSDYVTPAEWLIHFKKLAKKDDNDQPE